MQYLLKAGLSNHRIHWHCFEGDQHLADNLLKEFPNLKISISSKIQNNSQIQEAVTRIPIHCLVIETDRPYLDILGSRDNTPWSIEGHAKLVAEMKNLPLEVLFEISLANLVQLYNIPFMSSIPVCPPKEIERICFQGPLFILSNMFPCTISYQGITHTRCKECENPKCNFEVPPWPYCQEAEQRFR